MWVEGSTILSKKIFLLGITGGSGSGKTTMAQKIKQRVDDFFKREVVKILAQDSYYKDQSKKFDRDGGKSLRAGGRGREALAL